MGNEGVYKFSALLPRPLALEFTAKAREKMFKEKGELKGAISRAVREAIQLWLEMERDR